MKHAVILFLCGFRGMVLLAQNPYDILIHEIMADPSPVVGLPNYEWIELKNVSGHAISLQGFRIADAAAQSGPFPAFTLQPDSMVILCSSTAVNTMRVFGAVLPVSSFPSLDNDGDLLSLSSPSGQTIHAVAYTSGWYDNALKQDGGWSLEMTDAHFPCMGKANWKASTAATGGTPGRPNATVASLTDTEGPRLLRSYSTDSVTLVLLFDEPVDSIMATGISHYQISQGLLPLGITADAPLFSSVTLKLNQALQRNTVYEVSVTGIPDCSGNIHAGNMHVRAGVASGAAPGEWIINEVLFDPRPSGTDYAEMFNNGPHIIDASHAYIANRNNSGQVSSVKVMSPVPYFIYPGDYLVLTEDAAALAREYLLKEPGTVLEIPVLPAFPETEGTVVILDASGNIRDELHYNKDWHFKLITDPEGISLERIDPAGKTQDAQNWHSAAMSAGYGTPGYRNSQYRTADATNDRITVTPSLISPDNDGRDDVALIGYRTTRPGMVATVTIFSASGVAVRSLVRNELTGMQADWKWDGLDDHGRALPAGVYIVFTQLFSTDGKVADLKNGVVLVRTYQ